MAILELEDWDLKRVLVDLVSAADLHRDTFVVLQPRVGSGLSSESLKRLTTLANALAVHTSIAGVRIFRNGAVPPPNRKVAMIVYL